MEELFFMIELFTLKQYKKKIKLIVNVDRLLDGNKSNSEKISRKLNKRIGEYFDYRYTLDDFFISGMRIAVDINVGAHNDVEAYLKVLRRVGRVKGFKIVVYECFEDIDSLCWEGNSNGISFSLYDLESMCRRQFGEKEFKAKKYRGIIDGTVGILRAEVRLMKPKAVRSYTDRIEVRAQIADIMRKRKDIFMDTFIKIVPYGDYEKKDKTVEIVCRKIGDGRLRRRMLQLVVLIPEKKSLYLAQKAMKYRNMEKIMDEFAKISISPVTISKRQDVRQLRNIYECLCERT